jgi:hypothetical protein
MTYPSEKAADLIRTVGYYNLAATDGCICSHCSVLNVSVDVSCHRPQSRDPSSPLKWTGALIRVHGGESVLAGSDLEAVAKEVGRQLITTGWSYKRFRVRYCTSEQDRENKCLYCGKPRAEREGYLCAKCLAREGEPGYTDMKVRDEYDYSRLAGYVVAEGEDPEP